MKYFIIYSFMTLCLFYSSCGLPERVGKTTTGIFESLIETSIIVNQALKESTVFIYKNDSLELNKPIYIHQFEVSFESQSDLFKLQLDSIEAILANDSTVHFNKVNIIGDSIFYSQVIIPYHSFHKKEDSVEINVKCEYLPNMSIESRIDNLKCFTANYITKY